MFAFLMHFFKMYFRAITLFTSGFAKPFQKHLAVNKPASAVHLALETSKKNSKMLNMSCSDFSSAVLSLFCPVKSSVPPR